MAHWDSVLASMFRTSTFSVRSSIELFLWLCGSWVCRVTGRLLDCERTRNEFGVRSMRTEVSVFRTESDVRKDGPEEPSFLGVG
jgi:hypothetical protein